jgi:hypothetical protein
MEPITTQTPRPATTTTVGSDGLITTTSGGRHADLPTGAPPALSGTSFSGTAEHTVITLDFSTTMAAGSGTIYVTDGAVQTVIDRATGLPVMRIVGATDTHAIAVGSVHVDGTQVTIDATGLKPGHGYSVVMDAGVLVSSGHRVFGGLHSAAQASFDTPAAGDTQAPAVASIALDAATLAAGHGAGLTISFSEAVTFDPAAISTPNATLAGLHSIDGGRTWTATLAGAAGTTSASNLVSIDMGQVRDLAGNAGSGTASSASYAVDTVAPNAPTIALDGAVLGAGHAIGITLQFGEAVSLDAAAFTTPHASLSNLHSTDGGRTWLGTLDAADAGSSSGNTISLDMSRVPDLAGNHGSGAVTGSASYAVNPDLTPPAAASVSLDGTTLSAGHGAVLTIMFSEAVTLPLAAISAPNAMLAGLHSIDAGRTWTATLTGAAGTTSASNLVSIDMSQVRDLAGIAGSGTASSASYTVDTVAPAAPTIALDGATLGPAHAIGFTLGFAEAVALDASAFMAPHASVGSLQTLDGGRTWSGLLTTTDSTSSNGNLLALDMAKVHDLAGNAGSGIAASTASYAVDAVAPAAPSITLAGTMLGASYGIEVEIKFAEAIPELDAAAIHAPHATVTRLTTLDHITWYASLAGAADATAKDQAVSIDMGMVRDSAGNSGKGSATGEQHYTVDTRAPTLAGPIVLDGAVLGAGHPIEVTLSFSESAYLLPGALAAQNAVITDMAPADEAATTWKLTLALAPGAASSAESRLTIDMGKVLDSFGNAGSGSVASGAYAVEPGAGLAPGVSIWDDGISDSDYLTSENQVHLSGGFIGDLDEGQQLHMKIDDVAVTPHTGNSEVGGQYWSYDSEDTFRDGIHHVTVWLEDHGGHVTSSISQDITVDTVAPMIDPAWGNGERTVDASAPLSITFSEPVYLYDSGSNVVMLWNDTGGATPVYLDARNLSADHRSLTIAADDMHLAPGKNYHLSLPYWTMDAAGNPVGENELQFRTNAGAYTDATGPRVVAAEASLLSTPATGYGDSYGAGAAIEIRVRFNEGVRLQTGPAPSLQLNTGGTAAYYGTSEDQHELIFHYTVGAGDADASHLDITAGSALAGRIVDLAGNALDAASIDFSVLSHLSGGYGDGIGIDTHAPAALATAVLDEASDHGASHTDGITNDNTPTLHGTGAETNAHAILVHDGAQVVGYGYANADGTWWATVSESTTLGDGTHTLTVSQLDQAGNESPRAGQVTVSVDTARPGAPTAPVLAASSDTGSLNTDGITMDNTPTFNGSGTDPNSVVKLYANETLVGSTVSNDKGEWSITASTLLDGTYSVSAKQLDLAGNASSYSNSATITIDTVAPTVTGVANGPLAGDFSIYFSEAIAFTPDTSMRVLTLLGIEVAKFIHGVASGWEIANDASGAASVLEFHSALPGSYHMLLAPGTLHDLAGNAAVIGTPDFPFEIRLPSH